MSDTPVISNYPTSDIYVDRNGSRHVEFTCNVTDNNGIRSVWAVLTPDVYPPGVSVVSDIPLTLFIPPSLYKFSATLPDYNETNWTITIYAKDKQGFFTTDPKDVFVKMYDRPQISNYPTGTIYVDSVSKLLLFSCRVTDFDGVGSVWANIYNVADPSICATNLTMTPMGNSMYEYRLPLTSPSGVQGLWRVELHASDTLGYYSNNNYQFYVNVPF
jgi:hypothetical protein